MATYQNKDSQGEPEGETKNRAKMTLGERVQLSRQFAGLTQKELADRAEISQTAIHKLECGQSRSSRRLVIIAMACGVDPVWLETGLGDMAPGISDPESIPLTRRKRVTGSEDSGLLGPARLMRIPLVSWEGVSDWKEWADPLSPPNVHEWVSLPRRGNGLTVALRVSDDSMEPEFLEGDVIIINLVSESKHGRFVVASTSSGRRATFKQLILDGEERYLKPLNDRYPVANVTDDAIIHGVVTTKYREYS
ncbi:MAG: LexA family transcriptional regulator [Magnetococcales bacterium]|nr:LexA family transcriptional regulator [Magnetococcales bacterium]